MQNASPVQHALSPVKNIAGNDKSHALAEEIMRRCFQRGVGLNITDSASTAAKYGAIVLAIQSKNLLGLRNKIEGQRDQNTDFWQGLIKKYHHQINSADLVRLGFLQ